MEWDLLPVISAPMPFQMALDEILFRDLIRKIESGSAANPILRFYYSSESWASLGYTYRGPIPSAKNVCRRITGGGIVHHGTDLIFSLVAKKSDDETFSSVRVSYWKIHEAVKAGFEKTGVSARFYRVDDDLPKGADCFKFPIPTDLAVDAQKAAGGAQKRSQGALLHQESIRIPRGVTSDELRKSLCLGFESVFKVALHSRFLDPEDLHRAGQLSKCKYENPDCVAFGYSQLSQVGSVPDE